MQIVVDLNVEDQRKDDRNLKNVRSESQLPLCLDMGCLGTKNRTTYTRHTGGLLEVARNMFAQRANMFMPNFSMAMRRATGRSEH